MTRPDDERRWVPQTFGAPPAGAAAPPADTAAPPAAAVPAPRQTVAPQAGATAELPTLAPPATRAGTEAGATATALATATTTASRPRSRALGSSLATPDAGRSGPPRPPRTDEGPGSDQAGPSGRMARLRIGSHTVSPAALARLSPSPLPAGLVLGADRRRAPVTVTLFRPEPTRVSLVGGVWAAQLLAFRSLAMGARIVVLTTDPAAWSGFGPTAFGRPTDRVQVRTDPGVPVPTGTAQRPVLLIHDARPGTAEPSAAGPWQTHLSVVRRLEPAIGATVGASELCVLQRLAAAEAAVAGHALRLPADSVRFLQVMADDMLTLVGAGADRHLWVGQTDVERHLLGAPRR